MNYWKIVEIENFRKYAKEFFLYYYNNSNHFKKYNNFWTQFKPEYYDEYFNENNRFGKELKKFGSINEIAILFLWHKDESTLHIDHTIELNSNIKARLNLPIINCEGSYTTFYNIPKEYVNKFKESKGGTKTWDSSLKEILSPVTKVELVQPTIIRTSSPHTVIMTGNKFPRISMTISFKEDLIKYLE